MVERSLILVKPDAMQRGLAGAILSRLEAKGLKLAALRMLHLDRALAERHYAVHAGKSFFKFIEFLKFFQKVIKLRRRYEIFVYYIC